MKDRQAFEDFYKHLNYDRWWNSSNDLFHVDGDGNYYDKAVQEAWVAWVETMKNHILLPLEPTDEIWEAFTAYDGNYYTNEFDKDDFVKDYAKLVEVMKR